MTRSVSQIDGYSKLGEKQKARESERQIAPQTDRVRQTQNRFFTSAGSDVEVPLHTHTHRPRQH